MFFVVIYIMEISDIIKSSLKIAGLGLLAFNLNSCSPQRGVVEGYMNALMDEDVEEVREYCTKKRAGHVNPLVIRILKNVYDGYELHSYIPREGKIDRGDIWWIERKDGMYNQIVLAVEGGEWKISDISSPIDP